MELSFGFGTGSQCVSVPEENLLGVLHMNPAAPQRTGQEAVRYALENPVGLPRLSELVPKSGKIAIITSDVSRPCPSWDILPPLLEELERGGADLANITLVFGLGSHRHQTEAEMRHLAGDAYDRIHCVDSDCNDCIRLGVTSRGTPVDITRAVAEADFRICLGNVEYHYFAGYSGGAKAIMPGVSSRDAIQANHRMMVRSDACAGRLDDNPLRQDIEEAGKICGISYIVNVVLDEHKQIISAAAGDSVAAHRVLCQYLDTLYRKPIPQRSDIVLVSQGGAPKDLNLYQTQKALDNAKHAVKPGGIIILIGSCKEGLGEKCFERWIREANCAHDLIDRVQTHFELGGHKAAAIAMVLENARIFLVSEMDPALVKKCFLEPYSSAQQALTDAFGILGPKATVLAMPYGGSTLPIVETK